MAQGFRARLTITIIALVAISAVVLAATSYVLLRNSLRERAKDAGVAQAEFNIGVLASPDQLPPGADLAEFERSGLAARFQTRGTSGMYVDFGDGNPFASSLELLETPDLADPELVELVGSGQLGWQFLKVGADSRLLVAGRRPPAGPDFYFYFDAAPVDQALGLLARFLLAGAGAVLVIGVLVAGTVARGVLRPVRSASQAAGRLARGDLGTRVPVESADEFGRWAESFNHMAAALEEKVAELEEAQAREQRFVADVSHELRTPLTALTTEAALLAGHLDDLPPEGRRAAELLTADIARLRRLVDELLEVSRLDRAPEPAELSPTDLHKFLAAIIRERLPGARVTGEIPTEPLLLDRRGLERVLANLLDNAAVHAPGATVEVEVRAQSHRLTILVDDDGPGVAPEELAHLFDRFYKSDRSRQGGSGLGLAIAREHARRLGGDLEARRREPRGLIFELSLPVTEPLHDGEAAEKSVSQAEPVDQ